VGISEVIEPNLDAAADESSSKIGASVAKNSEELSSNARGRFFGSALNNLCTNSLRDSDKVKESANDMGEENFWMTVKPKIICKNRIL
jgi:hypothetical protein